MDSIRSETSGKSSSSRVKPAKIKKRPVLIAKSLEVIRKISIKETGVKNTTNKETYKYILPPVLSQIHIFDK